MGESSEEDWKAGKVMAVGARKNGYWILIIGYWILNIQF
jgi:hypothetical protein